jgi:hypothetical protein
MLTNDYRGVLENIHLIHQDELDQVCGNEPEIIRLI